MIAFAYRRNGHVAINVSVNGPLRVRRNEAGIRVGRIDSGSRERADFTLFDALWIGAMVADVVIEVPALVLVDGDIDGHEFVINIPGVGIGSRCAGSPQNRQRGRKLRRAVRRNVNGSARIWSSDRWDLVRRAQEFAMCTCG